MEKPKVEVERPKVLDRGRLGDHGSWCMEALKDAPVA